MSETKDILTLVGMLITVGISYGVTKSESGAQVEKINQLEYKVGNFQKSNERLRLNLAENSVKLASQEASTGASISELVKQLDNQKNDFLAKDRVLEALADVKELKEGTVPERRIIHIEDDINKNKTVGNDNRSMLLVLSERADSLEKLGKTIHSEIRLDIKNIDTLLNRHEMATGHFELSSKVSKIMGDVSLDKSRILSLENMLKSILSKDQKKSN
jgi:hypothetical protein